MDAIGRDHLLTLLDTGEVTLIEALSAAAVLLGAGSAMVYPALLASVDDVAPPHVARARAVGVLPAVARRRLAGGAVLAGVLADTYGIRAATAAVAALTAASGLYVWARTYETRTDSQRGGGGRLANHHAGA